METEMVTTPGYYFRFQNTDLSWSVCYEWTMEVICTCADEMDAMRIIQALTLLYRTEEFLNGPN